MPCDNESRDWNYTAVRHGKPKIASKPPEAKKQ